ncbi:hypothetical protein Btru_008839 [Bulinus truncatus]|nr:hypothetical protein Btru_008839 [Bulinus truncatus]
MINTISGIKDKGKLRQRGRETDKMRTSKQIKVITSQVEVLDELRMQLENIQTNIVSLMKIGTSWVEETDHQSYTEINQLLSNETAECIRRCSRIADGDEYLHTYPVIIQGECSDRESQSRVVPPVSLQDGKEYQNLLDRLYQVDTSISSLKESGKNTEENYLKLSQCYEEMKHAWTKNSEKIGALYQKVNDQENDNKTVLMQLSKTDSKCVESMSKFQATSDSVKDLQKQVERLSITQSKENNSFNKISSLDDSVSNILHKQTHHEEKFRTILMTQESAEIRFCLKIDKILKEISELTDNLNKVKAQQESVCNKINENQERINEICGFVDKLTNLQEKFKGHEELVYQLEKSQNALNESNRNKMDEIQLGFGVTNASVQKLQSESNALSLQSQKLKADFGVTSVDFQKLQSEYNPLSLQ